MRVPVERRHRKAIGRNAIERKAGDSLSEAKRNLHRLVAEIQQEVAVKVGEADRVTRWRQEWGKTPPERGSLEWELMTESVDLGNPEAVADADAYLENRRTYEELLEERVLYEKPRQSTQKNWQSHIKKIKTFAGSSYPHVVTKEIANKFKKHLMGEMSDNSARATISCLKGFWSYGVASGYLETNVWDGLTKKLEKAVKHKLPSDEVIRAADQRAEESNDVRYWVMRYTGCRKGDANGLRFCDVDLEKGYVWFREWEQGGVRRHLKGGDADERQVPIHSKLRPWLEALMAGNEGSSEPIWPKAYKPSVESWGDGWAGSFKQKFGFNSHDLRRRAVTQLMVAKVSPFVLFEVTRHTIPGMSDVVKLYVRPAPEEVKEAVETIQ